MRAAKPILLPSLTIATALLLSACNTTNQTQQTAMVDDWSSVTDKEWVLTKVTEGNRTLEPMSPVLASANFASDGKIAGSTGCNRYFGNYTRSESGLTMSPLGATQMMCMEDAMEIEHAFTSAMEDVADWKVIDTTLSLSDSSGKVIMEFGPIAR
ncbi:MAG: META domain-containing protein [Porticoccaceae bacterium]|uniref:META domain-containing protein n=1 Tax=Thalassospira sp. TaxID=1912094 RepID=UPI003A8914D5